MSILTVDKNAADAIYRAVTALDQTVMIARREGLDVDLRLVEHTTMSGARSFITAKVSREIK